MVFNSRFFKPCHFRLLLVVSLALNALMSVILGLQAWLAGWLVLVPCTVLPGMTADADIVTVMVSETPVPLENYAW